VDPGPLTIRTLFDMAYGAWEPWAQLTAIIAEANRDDSRRKRPFTEADFHPLMERTATSRGGMPLTPGVLHGFIQALPDKTKR